MANWDNLKAAIQDVIKENGNEEITGQVLQNTLLSIVNNLGENATFAGLATPTTNPGTPDGVIFYVATQQGTYQYFNNLVVNKGETAIFLYKTNWTKISIAVIPAVPNVLQNSGTSPRDVMSQNAVTAIVGIDDIPQFSEQTSYQAGDFVRHTGLIFKFTAAHSAGLWKGTDTTPSSLAEYIKATTGATVEAVQEWGDSETDVMSQKALTDKIFKDGIQQYAINQYYYKGDYVVHDNKLYQLYGADSHYGNWDESIFREISIAEFVLSMGMYALKRGRSTSGNPVVEAQRLSKDFYDKEMDHPVCYSFYRALNQYNDIAYLYYVKSAEIDNPDDFAIGYIGGEPVGLKSEEAPYLCGITRRRNGVFDFIEGIGRTYIFDIMGVDFISTETLGSDRMFSDYEYAFLKDNFQLTTNGWRDTAYLRKVYDNTGTARYFVLSLNSAISGNVDVRYNMISFKEKVFPTISKSRLISPLWDGTTFTIRQEILDLFGLDSKYDLKDNATALLYVKDCPIIKRFRYKNSVTGDWRELYFDGKDDADRQKIWCWKQAESNEHKEYYLRREENSDNNTYYFPVEEMMCRGKVHISPAPAGGITDWVNLDVLDKGDNPMNESPRASKTVTEFDVNVYANKIKDTRRTLKYFNGDYFNLYLEDYPTDDYVVPTSANLITKNQLVAGDISYSNNEFRVLANNKKTGVTAVYVPVKPNTKYYIAEYYPNNLIQNEGLNQTPIAVLNENKELIKLFDYQELTKLKGGSSIYNTQSNYSGLRGAYSFTTPESAAFVIMTAFKGTVALTKEIYDYPIILCEENNLIAAVSESYAKSQTGLITGDDMQRAIKACNKNIWLLGDSIASGAGQIGTLQGGSSGGWLRYFIDIVKPNAVYNKAMGGYTLTDIAEPGNDGIITTATQSYISELEAIISDYEGDGTDKPLAPDYVFICGCANDVGKIRSGLANEWSGYSYVTKDDLANETINPDGLDYNALMEEIFVTKLNENKRQLVQINTVPMFKIAGAILYIVKRVGSLFPNCKFVIATNIINTMSVNWVEQENCNNEMRWIANRLSIPVIDVARRANTVPLWDYSEWGTDTQLTRRRFLNDNVHPYGSQDTEQQPFNTAAAMYIGNLYAEEFKRICFVPTMQDIEVFDFAQAAYPHDKNVIYNA